MTRITFRGFFDPNETYFNNEFEWSNVIYKDNMYMINDDEFEGSAKGRELGEPDKSKNWELIPALQDRPNRPSPTPGLRIPERRRKNRLEQIFKL